MLNKLKSIAFRFGVPLAAFVLILLTTIFISRFLSFSLDLTSLIIALLIATAWFMGRNPGLLIAIVFEATLIYFQSTPYTTKSAVITFNRLVLFCSIVLFASSRRKAEMNLREQRELLRVTLASIGDAVIATGSDGKINFINPAAENLTGWNSKDACEKPLEEVFKILNEDTRKIVESPFTAVIKEGATVGLANHTILISKSGEETPIEDSGAPIKDTNGKIAGVVIVFHDVTERRRIEKEREELLKSEQLARREAERAGILKDEFLATVSHELRTPLNAILGWSAMISKGDLEEASVLHALNVIKRNAHAQAEIISDILDVSRIITGKLQLQPQPLNLTPIVHGAVETLQPAALAKSIEINLRLDENAGEIIGDKDRLQQIIWNLLSNAVKFTPEGGTIGISLKKSDARIELKVSDNGIGIEKQFLPFIFERFRQLDSSITRTHGGLGLGLSIVRHLVEMHGGTVKAESAGLNQGTIFTIQLPLADNFRIPESTLLSVENSYQTDGHEKIDTPDLRGCCVLLVDDDADTLEILRFILEKTGAEIRTAASVAAALEIFQNWKPSVIISDIGMPVEDGYSFIRRLREQGETIPAAALSAYTRNEDQAQALAAGFQAHISKPVSPYKLITIVAELIKNKSLFKIQQLSDKTKIEQDK